MEINPHHFKSACDNITEQVKSYRGCEIEDVITLLTIQKELAGTAFYLETCRAEYHTRHQTIMNKLILEGSSVAAAEIKANVQVPEIYYLRRTMGVVYEILSAIRTQISYIKNELKESKAS